MIKALIKLAGHADNIRKVSDLCSAGGDALHAGAYVRTGYVKYYEAERLALDEESESEEDECSP